MDSKRNYDARTPEHRYIRVRCITLRSDGLTASQVADRLGISRNAVIGHWWRFDNGNGRTISDNHSAA